MSSPANSPQQHHLKSQPVVGLRVDEDDLTVVVEGENDVSRVAFLELFVSVHLAEKLVVPVEFLPP